MPRTAELRRQLDRWARRLERRSPQTAKTYRHAVSRFIGSLGSGTLTADAVETWIDGLAGAPASQALYISAVRNYLRFLQAEGLLPKAPLDALVRPRVTVTSYGRYLTADELQTLFDAARALSPRHFATVATLTLTGCRISEIAGARWSDLYRDPEGRLGLRIVGKGGKERPVKVRADLFAALSAVNGSTDLNAADRTPLIPSDRRGTCSTRTLQRLVSETVSRSGLRKAASAHWLRHSHATLAAGAGADALTIQESLGHARLDTSQRYVHLARGLTSTTVDALPAFD